MVRCSMENLSAQSTYEILRLRAINGSRMIRSNVSGEAVFTTSLVGYPESLTDPSYRGQMYVSMYRSDLPSDENSPFRMDRLT